MKKITICLMPFFVGVVLIAFAYQHKFLSKSFHVSVENAKKIHNNATWTITAYCPGSCCNRSVSRSGVHDYTNIAAIPGITLRGLLTKGINVVAVDPAIIPYGSIIKYNDTYYIALDTGSAIKGFKLDILVASHDEANAFGVQQSNNVEVIIPSEPTKIIKQIQEIEKIRKP